MCSIGEVIGDAVERTVAGLMSSNNVMAVRAKAHVEALALVVTVISTKVIGRQRNATVTDTCGLVHVWLGTLCGRSFLIDCFSVKYGTVAIS